MLITNMYKCLGSLHWNEGPFHGWSATVKNLLKVLAPFNVFTMSSLDTIIFLLQIQKECSIWTNLDTTKDDQNNCATIWGLCLSIVSSLDDALSDTVQGDFISDTDLKSVSMFQCKNVLYSHIWKDHRESAKDRSTWVVNTRVQLILGQIGRPVAPLEFKFLLRNGPIGSHGKQEDDAFARLYRGYDATCLDSWVSIPPPPLLF